MGIKVEHHGPVAVITIDRADKRNALDRQHNEALYTATNTFFADDARRVAVLVGAGERDFCTGADPDTFIPWVRDAARRDEQPAWSMGGLTQRDWLPKPVIAAVNGAALAGGLELALACDFRIASPNATLGLTETKWALIPGAGGTQRLPRTVAVGHALEMLMTGDPISADLAERIGLVNRVVPPGDLVADAVSVAERIAARGPLAVHDSRRAAILGRNLPFAEGLGFERRLFLNILKTDDVSEGSRAWVEGRGPVYQGR